MVLVFSQGFGFMRTHWFRWYYALGLVLSLGSLIFALSLEYQQHVMPCALCQLQRLIFLLIGLSFLIALAKRLSYRLVYTLAWLNTLWCIFGLYFALRQLWLIHHAQADIGLCGGDIAFLLSNLAFSDALRTAFLGTGDCARITWTWFNITLPGWSAINYVALFVLSWVPVCCRKIRQMLRDTNE